jgi:hypothetical protein
VLPCNSLALLPTRTRPPWWAPPPPRVHAPPHVRIHPGFGRRRLHLGFGRCRLLPPPPHPSMPPRPEFPAARMPSADRLEFAALVLIGLRPTASGARPTTAPCLPPRRSTPSAAKYQYHSDCQFPLSELFISFWCLMYSLYVISCYLLNLYSKGSLRTGSSSEQLDQKED